MTKGHFLLLSQESENTSMREQSLDKLVTRFLTDMAHANRSPHTRRAYATDLAQLCAYHQGAVIERFLETIPAKCQRDQLFLRLLLETGLRISEGFSLYVEGLDLSLDNQHLTIVGKRSKKRTIRLDAPHLVQQLRVYLKMKGSLDAQTI
jgi:site-specific recombinase XerD